MKGIIFSLTILFSLPSFAKKSPAEIIQSLYKKGYDFFALKEKEVFFINGDFERIEITLDEFKSGFAFQQRKIKVKPQGIPAEIKHYTKQGAIIVIKRENKAYQISGTSKIKPFNIDQYVDQYANQERLIERFEETHCSSCTFNLSGNMITINESTQYAGEVAWLPYWKWGEKFGIRGYLGFSPYSAENEDLEETISLGVKVQALARQDIGQAFIDIGGGYHYFVEFGDLSVMTTAGLGYTFLEKHWILNEAIQYDSIFVHYSQIAWLQDITEIKLGISFNF